MAKEMLKATKMATWKLRARDRCLNIHGVNYTSDFLTASLPSRVQSTVAFLSSFSELLPWDLRYGFLRSSDIDSQLRVIDATQ